MITDVIHIATNQFENSCIFGPVKAVEMADDFSGDFFIRVDDGSKALFEGMVTEEKGSFLRVTSTLKTLTRLRETYRSNFLILYIVESLVS